MSRRDKIFIEQFVTKQFKSHRDGILVSLVNDTQIRTEPYNYVINNWINNVNNCETQE